MKIKLLKFQYQKQINDLKNELELLNGTITNLTEEKENNTIKLTELIQENEELKKTNLNNNNTNNFNINIVEKNKLDKYSKIYNTSKLNERMGLESSMSHRITQEKLKRKRIPLNIIIN